MEKNNLSNITKVELLLKNFEILRKINEIDKHIFLKKYFVENKIFVNVAKERDIEIKLKDELQSNETVESILNSILKIAIS